MPNQAPAETPAPKTQPAKRNRLERIPLNDYRYHRSFFHLDRQELLALPLPADGHTVQDAIEAAAEHQARKELTQQLKTDGPEQTMNWEAWFGPIEISHTRLVTIAVGLKRPDVSPPPVGRTHAPSL